MSPPGTSGSLSCPQTCPVLLTGDLDDQPTSRTSRMKTGHLQVFVQRFKSSSIWVEFRVNLRQATSQKNCLLFLTVASVSLLSVHLRRRWILNHAEPSRARLLLHRDLNLISQLGQSSVSPPSCSSSCKLQEFTLAVERHQDSWAPWYLMNQGQMGWSRCKSAATASGKAREWTMRGTVGDSQLQVRGWWRVNINMKRRTSDWAKGQGGTCVQSASTVSVRERKSSHEGDGK